MASYYKFAERQADSFVNWAEIGKGITDMIQTEVAIRDQKKAAIDQATRDNLKKVAEAPVGSHEGLNTWTLNYADSAREAILLQDRLLKSGGLKLKDYTVMRQNLNDGTDELFSVVKNFQNTYKEKRDRLISTDPKNRSQQIEMDLLAYTEKFGDFSKSAAIIDPRNFTVNVGLMEPDPNNQGVMKVGKQIATTSFLRKIQDTKVDYFDADTAADSISKSMGKYIRATIAEMSSLQGKVVTKEGIKNRPDYNKIIETSLKGIFSNPFNMTSILTENLVQDEQGRPYVSSISGKEGNVIQLKFNPATNYYEPELNKEQKDAVINYMKELIDFRIDDVIKEDPFNKPQRQVTKSESTPSGPSIDIQKKYLSRVKEKTGLSEKTFSNKRLETANNLQSILAKIPNGNQLSVELDKNPESGIINLKDGDNVIKSFYVYETNPEIRKGYLNEFTEIISNLAGTDGMVDYLGRTGGLEESGAPGTPLPSR
jgi:enamine deaminase RidA (YjgF/YER057c/UK114 family)